MLDLVFKTDIPIVGVVTDDPIHSAQVLQTIAGKEVKELGAGGPTKSSHGAKMLFGSSAAKSALYLLTNEQVTVETYQKLKDLGTQGVVLNPKENPLVFHAGVLLPPDSLVLPLLPLYGVPANQQKALLPALRGLSLKAIENLLDLTMARDHSITAKGLRESRHLLGDAVQGLTPVDTDVGYYEMPEELAAWIKENADYFLHDAPAQLVPRGLMFAGPPGTGKTQGVKAIAKALDVPLYRLDIGATLSKWAGESEQRVAQGLQMVEREAPCVLLLDEVEKIFDSNEDSSVMRRILGSLLWWLQEHHSKVLTVMTTNNLDALPPELYRPGRLDKVMVIRRLTRAQAKPFAVRVFVELMKSVKQGTPPLKQIQAVGALIDAGQEVEYSHTEVCALVYGLVKRDKLLKK